MTDQNQEAWWEEDFDEYHESTRRGGPDALGTTPSRVNSQASPGLSGVPPPSAPPPPPPQRSPSTTSSHGLTGSLPSTPAHSMSTLNIDMNAAEFSVSVSEVDSDGSDAGTPRGRAAEWEEFKLLDGPDMRQKSAWVNLLTHEISLSDPSTSTLDFSLLDTDMMQRARRHSQIHEDMMGDGAGDGDGTGGSGTSKNGAGPGAGAGDKNDRESALNRVLSRLAGLSTGVSVLLEEVDMLLVTEKLIHVRQLLEDTVAIVQEEAANLDDRNHVDALVDFRRLAVDGEDERDDGTASAPADDRSSSTTAPHKKNKDTTGPLVLKISGSAGHMWPFEGNECDAYRARATRFLHSRYLNQDMHMPQFFSEYPLPLDGEEHPKPKIVFAMVRMPEPIRSVMPHTRIVVKETDTVENTIDSAFKQVARTQASGSVSTELGKPSDYVLKAVGYNEYLCDKNTLYSYECTRQVIHDCQPPVELHLELVLRPSPIKPTEEARELVEEYRARSNPDTKVLGVHDYANLSVATMDWEEMHYFPMHEMNMPFRVRVLALENATFESMPKMDPSIADVYVRVFLYHGMVKLENSECTTRSAKSSPNVRWMQLLKSPSGQDIFLNQLPRETRLCVMVMGRSVDNKEDLLAHCCVQLVDEFGELKMGRRSFNLWPVAAKEKERDQMFLYRSTTRDNRADPNPAVIRLEFDEYMLPVVAPLMIPLREPKLQQIPAGKPSRQERKRIEELAAMDMLHDLDPADKQLIWNFREAPEFLSCPAMLPKFLQCVDWTNPEARMEAYRLMDKWAPVENPALALELLDSMYADYRVRQHAVDALRKLRDDELQLLLLQLTQCLKYEPYHDSPLTRFLIQRALENPFQVGHFFFWHVKAELCTPEFCERYGLVLEEYLSHAGEFASSLRNQNTAVLKLQQVAELIVKLKLEHKYSDAQCMKEYHLELEKLNRDFFSQIGSFPVPLDPRREATTLIVDKCRYMSSKKIPLWLVFNNKNDPENPIYIIFKSGDDLRQDILTLQLLKIMDKIWLNDGLDMRLKPYRCLATGVNDDGEGVGMIEVVLNSDTTSGIQLRYGGGALGALRLEPLDRFIRDHNTDENYKVAKENFIRSCAGYCVATFVLGIGDRHNGNIMVTKDGHLFHIDFGHFLGNFKKKFGFNRERAAFVFTPEMAYVIGGKSYKKSKEFKTFKNLCFEAFNSLRKHASLLENLFALMVSAGMPELMMVEDIHYLREKLCLEESPKNAEKLFQKEIKKSLDTTWRRIDNLIHNAKHG